MRAPFSEVLARESASLARVADEAKLDAWRRRVVEELMTPGSPYALALRPTGDMPDRADFLDRWRSLIAEAVERLPQSRASKGSNNSARVRRRDVDAQEAAMLILAALHGGNTLSQVAQDPWPLNAALDLALGPFAGHGGHGPGDDEEIG